MRAAGLVIPLAILVAAAAPRTDTIGFRTDTFGFRTDGLVFRTDGLAFRSAPLLIETAATIEVTLPADVLFDFDRADIRPTAQVALREVADLIRDKARGTVTINGYTDGLGKDDYNQKLSDRRAQAVKTWLATREGLRTAFTTAGFGSRSPVAPNTRPDGSDDPDGRQLNRRVTIVIRK